ncbi:hypothetical protein B586_19790 [Mycobacterium haemophilum DSM 44634]|nr:hypothetical protein B586_19790 [Mycobacterium haemophilum DSM 44634]
MIICVAEPSVAGHGVVKGSSPPGRLECGTPYHRDLTFHALLWLIADEGLEEVSAVGVWVGGEVFRR